MSVNKYWNISINRHEIFTWASYCIFPSIFILVTCCKFRYFTIWSRLQSCRHMRFLSAQANALFVTRELPYIFFLFWNCEWQLAYCCSSFSQIDTIFQCAYFLREFAFWMNDRVHLTFMNENEKFAIWINPCLTEYEKGFLFIYIFRVI